MPLNVKSISVNLAILFFFCLSIIALMSGLSPFVCCKRAIIGAFSVYIIANIAIRLINMVLIDAMITKNIEQLKNFDSIQNRKKNAGDNKSVINN